MTSGMSRALVDVDGFTAEIEGRRRLGKRALRKNRLSAGISLGPRAKEGDMLGWTDREDKKERTVNPATSVFHAVWRVHVTAQHIRCSGLGDPNLPSGGRTSQMQKESPSLFFSLSPRFSLFV